MSKKKGTSEKTQKGQPEKQLLQQHSEHLQIERIDTTTEVSSNAQKDDKKLGNSLC